MFKKMGTKLLIIFSSLSIIPFTVFGIISLINSGDVLSKMAFGKLENMREIKKTQIINYFQEQKREMANLINTVAMLRQAAFQKMRSVQENKKAAIEEYFKKCLSNISVISKNPLIAEAFGDFTSAVNRNGTIDMKLYSFFESIKYGNLLNQFKEEYGYHDLLLISKEGLIIYSLNRESDLGQNLNADALKDTNLGKGFQDALKHVAIFDFEPYSFSGNSYIAFVAAPVIQRNETVGLIVIKLKHEQINTIVRRREGMGKTGETYLAGKWNNTDSLRSDMFVNKGNIGETRSDPEITEALAGRSGSLVKIGANGKMDIVTYDPLIIEGLNWGIITAVNMEEVIAPRLKNEESDYFSKYVANYGYDDLLLIHPEGKVIYSVAHESDYGANILNTEYAETGLSRLLWKVAESQNFGFSDFEPYAPANGKLTAFIAQPVIYEDRVELVVALRLPIDGINAVMRERTGMGDTGETYLVGPDKLMRSDSYLNPEKYSVIGSFSDPEKRRITTPAVQDALSGKTDRKIITNYINDSVLSAYAPLNIFETARYALVAEIGKSEAFSGVNRLKIFMGEVAGITLIAVLIISFFFTEYLMRPIRRAVQFIRNVSEGNFSDSSDNLAIASDLTRKDEIGMMTNAVLIMKNRIYEVLKETDRLTGAVQNGRLNERGNAEDYEGGWRDLLIGINTVIDAFVMPIQMTAESVDMIAKGEIPEKIQDEYKGEFNNIRNNLNMLIDATNETSMIAEEIANGNLTVDVRIRSENDRLMNALNLMINRLKSVMNEVNQVTRTVREGNLNVRGNAEPFEGGWHELMVGLNSLIDAFAEPVSVTVTYLDRIACGDIPEKIDKKYRGDFNKIRNNLNQCIDTVNGLVAETVMLTQNAADGRLEIRGNAEKFGGDYARIIIGINNTLDAVITPLNTAAKYIERLSVGDFPDNIREEYKGDFDTLRNNLNLLISNLQAAVQVAEKVSEGNLEVNVNILSEKDMLGKSLFRMVGTLRDIIGNINNLTNAARAGNLDVRGETEKFGGEYKKIITGVNDTLDAVVSPMKIAAGYVEQIAEGEIPEKITETYNGDFNQIKKNLNLMIENLSRFATDVQRAAEQVAEGSQELSSGTEQILTGNIRAGVKYRAGISIYGGDGFHGKTEC